jgi:nitronate monooxygenase
VPFSLSDLDHPIVQAPMGGGPSTPALAAAVCEAGGLGFLAAGYRTPDAVRADIAELRRLTSRPFGLNVFVPGPASEDAGALERYAVALAGEAERLGVDLGKPRYEDDGWEEKLALAREEEVPVVSFVFGCPDAAVLAQLQTAGCAAWVTVTTPAEALAAADGGGDALVV